LTEASVRPLFAPIGPWSREANCLGTNPELFFSAETVVRAAPIIQAFCHGCRVRSECLEYAIENGFDRGIYGGELMKGRKRRVAKNAL
jgi:WhiB family transcriptional regulator, redox-sensing transcriptional regulator